MESFLKIIALGCALNAMSPARPTYAQITVVNMIPPAMSGETNPDNQPNLAVNPANPQHIAGTALTPDPLAGPYAPIFKSIDNGDSWTTTTIMPINDVWDQTIRFGSQTNILYGAILGPPPVHEMNVVRTKDFLSASPMTIINCNNTASSPCFDHMMYQPYIEVISAPPLAEPPTTPCDPTVTTCPPLGGDCNPLMGPCPPNVPVPGPAPGPGDPGSIVAPGTLTDRVYVGNFDIWKSRAASVYRSLNASVDPPPAQFVQINPIDVRPPCVGNGFEQWTEAPSVRTAPHSSGVVYAMFLRVTYCTNLSTRGDVVVVRDDNWGRGPNAFQALKEPNGPKWDGTMGDGLPGMRVVRDNGNHNFPFFGGSLNGQPVGSNISIAVDPNNSQRVFIVWFESHSVSCGGTCSYGVFMMHVRRSLDGGQTWSDDLRQLTSSTNPSIAINNQGAVGLLYQKHVGWWPDDKWEARFEYTTNDFVTIDEYVLHSASVNYVPTNNLGPLGIFNHLMAVDKNFYGIFSSSNHPSAENFPYGVKYQRNVSWSDRRLLAVDNITLVEPSIDPFFFRWEGPVNLNKCVNYPILCRGIPILSKGRILLKCVVSGCIIKDLIPKNCLMKYTCPGCEVGGMCPPFYTFHLEGLSDTWSVSLFDGKNRAVKHRKYKTRTGTIISFRPDKGNYTEGSIGDYFLAFEMGKEGKVGVNYPIKARLVRSNQGYQPGRDK